MSFIRLTQLALSIKLRTRDSRLIAIGAPRVTSAATWIMAEEADDVMPALDMVKLIRYFIPFCYVHVRSERTPGPRSIFAISGLFIVYCNHYITALKATRSISVGSVLWSRALFALCWVVRILGKTMGFIVMMLQTVHNEKLMLDCRSVHGEQGRDHVPWHQCPDSGKSVAVHVLQDAVLGQHDASAWVCYWAGDRHGAAHGGQLPRLLTSFESKIDWSVLLCCYVLLSLWLCWGCSKLAKTNLSALYSQLSL